MIKNIVFDLDGTLWQTTDSYVYAYHKLCEYYNVESKVSDQTVKCYLGVRLDILLNDLFPTVEDKTALGLRALEYSVEYLMQNQSDCCYNGVYDLLKALSADYNVFIVSNCLKGYVQAFLQISGTTDFVKEYFTIEKGEKEEHLNAISLNYGKALYVGDCDDDYLAIKNHQDIIFCYASYGYKSCKQYDYKISAPLELLSVVEKIKIKERQLKGKPYYVISNGDNQLTVIKNNDYSYYFGFVNYADAGFESVVLQLKEKQYKNIVGPIDGNTFYPYRFAIDHFDLVFYPDCVNGQEVVNAFINNGFAIKQRYVSTVATVNKRMWDLAKLVKIPSGYSVKVVSGKDAYEYLDQIYEVSIDAFAQADFYEPISKQDFVDIYMKNIDAVSPDMILIFRDNRLVGYNFCYEDPLKRYYVCKTTAIKQSDRNNKLIMIMVDYSYSLLVEKGYKYALHHFQNDRTKTLHAIFKGNEVLQKHYALLELNSDN